MKPEKDKKFGMGGRIPKHFMSVGLTPLSVPIVIDPGTMGGLSEPHL
jgi:hypothetical protein